MVAALIFVPRTGTFCPVRSCALQLLCLWVGLLPAVPSFAADKAPQTKRFVLYATFVSDTPVELSDGSRWLMDRGDSFPVLMFKEAQTRVVLQFAGAQFITETSRVKLTEGEEVTPEMVANYRRNVAGYVEGKSEKILQELKPPKEAEPNPKAPAKSKKPTPKPRF